MPCQAQLHRRLVRHSPINAGTLTYSFSLGSEHPFFRPVIRIFINLTNFPSLTSLFSFFRPRPMSRPLSFEREDISKSNPKMFIQAHVILSIHVFHWGPSAKRNKLF
ncbi:hypothetical protein AMECASPLE_033022 [Ameca splendens]|uniref:Uncharacterized protein n=1 Tax=Ameca splendens TaxID=208324 RepID=A0ABV0ZG81_9TELE